MSKKISIVIPVYNGGQYLKRCIDSICDQTYTDWEIIAIDDGSSDDSLEILEECKKYIKDKLTIITQENRGVARTRNRGIEVSQGDYLMFIDNDDYVDRDYFENYLAVIEKEDCDCVIGGFRREDDQGKVTKRFVPDTMWSVCTADLVPWARIFKRKFIVDNRILFLDNAIGEDIYFNFKLFSFTKNIAIINNTSYVWFYNSGSVSNVNQRGLKDVQAFVHLLDEIWKVAGDDRLVKTWLLRYVIWYLLYSGKYAAPDKFAEADKVLFEWLESHDITWKYVKTLCLSRDGMAVMRIAAPVYMCIHNNILFNLFLKVYCGKE